MTYDSPRSRPADPADARPDPQVTDAAALGQTVLVDAPVTADALVAAGVGLRPSPRQLAWQRLEVTAFVHFGVNTYTGHEWGDGMEDPAIFAPDHLDCGQWARELAAAGARLAILTIKHHDGFVLYPTRYTDHSVRASSWRSGRGDVLREFADACRAHGLRVGIYISPADEHEFRYGRYANGSARTMRSIPSPVTGDDRPADGPRFELPATDYGTYMLDQLYEALTEYGPIDVVWFDGANGHVPDDRVEAYDFDSWCRLVRELSPGTVLDDKAPDARWVGNEDGLARADDEWSIVPTSWTGRRRGVALDETLADVGSRAALAAAAVAGADGMSWWPAEADVSIRPGWFHHPEESPKTPSELLDIYHSSVGRNAVLLLNVPPTPDGRFDEADVASLRAWRALVDADLPGDLAAAAARTGDGSGGVVVQFADPVDFDRIVLREDIEHDGQQVEAAVVAATIDGETWRDIATVTTIGHRRILRLPSPITAVGVRVEIVAARASARVGVELHRSTVPTDSPATGAPA
jgi:alpha-L-fucosidase